MKFGLFYLPTYLPDLRDAQTHYRGIVEQIEFADQIGIDYAWIVEHHFVRHGGLFPANYAFLSYLAARTKRIRLGTGATVLPLNDAVRVAEQAATLDQLSQGRFDFGVGRGFIRDEFDIFGVDMKDSRERVEEGVDHAHFLDSDDDTKLQQIVHKPMSEYAAAGIEAARKPPDPTAYKGYERREAGQRDFGFGSYFPGRVVMGGPNQVIERIHVLRDIGITQIGLLVDFGSLPQAEIMRSLHVFADRVLPHVRDI